MIRLRGFIVAAALILAPAFALIAAAIDPGVSVLRATIALAVPLVAVALTGIADNPTTWALTQLTRTWERSSFRLIWDRLFRAPQTGSREATAFG